MIVSRGFGWYSAGLCWYFRLLAELLSAYRLWLLIFRSLTGSLGNLATGFVQCANRKPEKESLLRGLLFRPNIQWSG